MTDKPDVTIHADLKALYEDGTIRPLETFSITLVYDLPGGEQRVHLVPYTRRQRAVRYLKRLIRALNRRGD